MTQQINPSYKIIADHLRSCCFLIADGILPSNEGRGYVLRRIMRRAMLHVHKLGSAEPLMYRLVDILIKEMGGAFPELQRAKSLMVETLTIEEEKFRETLTRGMDILEEEEKRIKKGHKFSGATAFKLYDTYGFPLDLTQNILKEKGIEVDSEEFDSEMKIQKDRAKASWSGSGEAADDSLYFDLKEKYGKTEFLGYEGTKSEGRILVIIQDGKEVDKINKSEGRAEVILDKTPFYATSGGQKGDDGNIILKKEDKGLIEYSKINNIIDISETKKYADGLFSHIVSDIKGEFKVGDKITALVNNRNRQFRAQNHSSTHLLHYVLKQVLGDHITQKGSNVDAKYLTFDFNHQKGVTKEELNQVEDLVNFYIRQNTPITTEIMAIDDARKKGAMALFGEKYDDEVRVLSMGKSEEGGDLSVELCGGTHLKGTGNIGIFKIISEKGIAAGIRRIEAKSGYFALEHLKLQEKKLESLLESLKIKQQFDEIKLPEHQFHSAKKGFDDISYFADEVSGNEVTSAEEIKLIEESVAKTYQLGADKITQIKEKDKEIEKLKKDKLTGGGSDSFTSEKIGDITLIHHTFEGVDAKELRNVTNGVKSKKEYQEKTVIAFFCESEGKVGLCLSVSSDLTSKFNAGKMISSLVDEIGGKGGGGKEDFAMGGGSDKSGTKNSIEELKKLLNS